MIFKTGLKAVASCGFVLSCAVLAGACGGSSSSSPAPAPVSPGAVPSPSASPTSSPSAWTQVVETIRCESLSNQQCQGFYGFTVLSNGSFQVGPADDGTLLNGTLAVSEINLITADANAVVAGGGENGADECVASASVVGSSDQIVMTFADQNTSPVYDRSLQQICYRGGQSNAQKLQFDLNQLLQKYYPVPFPQPQPTPSTSPTPIPQVQDGRWGGNGAFLNVNDNGGVMDFKCSKGTLDETLYLDPNGNFDVTGTVLNQSGPIPVGHPHVQQPAEFHGNVQGNLMNITVDYTDDNGDAQSASYSLIYGNAGAPGLCAS